MMISVPLFVIVTVSFKTWHREKKTEFAIISGVTGNCHPIADSSYAIVFATCHRINDKKSGTGYGSDSSKSDRAPTTDPVSSLFKESHAERYGVIGLLEMLMYVCAHSVLRAPFALSRTCLKLFQQATITQKSALGRFFVCPHSLLPFLQLLNCSAN